MCIRDRYQVIDLGKDVSPETVADAAVREGAGLVGLSALMTTTVGKMEETLSLIHIWNSRSRSRGPRRPPPWSRTTRRTPTSFRR